MADNVLGIKITDLEEAQAAGLTDDALLIVESETPPTKRSKLSTFFTWIRGKMAAWTLSSYDEIMATTDDEFWASATGIKDGFKKTDSKKIVIKETGKSFPETNVGANTSITLTMAPTTHDGYTCIGISGFGGTDGPVVIQAARFNPESGKLTIKIRNTSSAAYKCTPTVDVLYGKNENVTIK